MNPSSGILTAHVIIDAEALGAGVAYTRTAAYLATAASISIPPGAASWVESRTCATFAADQLTYECTYNNTGNTTIRSGPADASDEACMAIGYFFPATGPLLCVDNAGPF